MRTARRQCITYLLAPCLNPWLWLSLTMRLTQQCLKQPVSLSSPPYSSSLTEHSSLSSVPFYSCLSTYTDSISCSRPVRVSDTVAVANALTFSVKGESASFTTWLIVICYKKAYSYVCIGRSGNTDTKKCYTFINLYMNNDKILPFYLETSLIPCVWTCSTSIWAPLNYFFLTFFLHLVA